MKKFVALIVSIGVAAAAVLDGYWLFFSPKETASAPSVSTTSTPTSAPRSATANAQASNATTSAGTGTASNNTVTSSSSAAAASTSGYKDGTYTGSVVSTDRGDVQVQVTVSAGKITNVQALEYPNDNPRSSSINAQALPLYKQEVLSAQSSKIQAISGATTTYGGYQQSLQAALDQAG